VSAATFARIALTLALAPLFVRAGLVGPRWAVVCQSIPVGVEVAVAWYFSRPFASVFPSSRRQRAQAPRDRLVQPAALAGRVSHDPVGMLLGAVIAKIKPARAHVARLLSGCRLGQPHGYAATRLQNVVLRFPPRSRTDRLTRRFALRAGTIVSFVPLVFLLPALSHWYYVSLQRLAPADLSLVTVSALLLVGYPFTSGLRAHWEGLAALARRTIDHLAGNIAFVAALAITAPSLPGAEEFRQHDRPHRPGHQHLAGLGALVLLQSLPEGPGPVEVIDRARAWLTKRLAAKKLRFTATACQPSSAP